MNQKLRLFISDDHALFREGVKAIMKEEPHIEVVGEATDGNQAVELVNRLKPDVVLMDIAMPNLKGFDATRRIKQANPDVKILILTIYEDEDMVARCLDSGASGYILKDTPPAQLLYAIQTVQRGEQYISPRVVSTLVSHYVKRNEQTKTRYDLLSDREREILVLLAEGLAMKEIAGRLGISTKTVDAHRHKVMRKLGLSDRSELVRYAIRKKLIEA